MKYPKKYLVPVKLNKKNSVICLVLKVFDKRKVAADQCLNDLNVSLLSLNISSQDPADIYQQIG